MRALLVTTTLVVAGALTTACGNGGSEPAKAQATPSASSASSAASTTEFCASYNSLYDAFPAGEQPSDKEAVAAIKEWAGEMESTGLPKDVPAPARKGFELVTATIDEIQPGSSQAEIQKLSADMTSAEQEQSQAFGAYATETCPTPGAPSGGASTPAPSN